MNNINVDNTQSKNHGLSELQMSSMRSYFAKWSNLKQRTINDCFKIIKDSIKFFHENNLEDFESLFLTNLKPRKDIEFKYPDTKTERKYASSIKILWKHIPYLILFSPQNYQHFPKFVRRTRQRWF